MGNKEKNKYVKEQLKNTLFLLLKEKDIDEISICELTSKAQVGRASFYRNYESMQMIIKEEIDCKLRTWQSKYDQNGTQDINDMFGSLFHHFKDNEPFYLLIYHRGLLYLLLDSIKGICGPKSEHQNLEAYFAAFMSYGLYGWVEEWFARGMQECAESMAALLALNGMK